MSSLDSYRRNVARKREEIAKLQQRKAKEQAGVANLSGKLPQALSRASSASTAKSKLREIEIHQKDQATAEKKVPREEEKESKKRWRSYMNVVDSSAWLPYFADEANAALFMVQ